MGLALELAFWNLINWKLVRLTNLARFMEQSSGICVSHQHHRLHYRHYALVQLPNLFFLHVESAGIQHEVIRGPVTPVFQYNRLSTIELIKLYT